METAWLLLLVPAQSADCMVGKVPSGCPVLPIQASSEEHGLWGQKSSCLKTMLPLRPV